MHKIIQWFVDNPIASKLIMLVIFVAGTLSYPLLDKEYFPLREIDLIKVTVNYPGAGPIEVETQICLRIEEVVSQIGGIEEVRSVAREEIGEVIIEVKAGENTQRILNDVKANVDAINTFPAESERPQIVELRWKIPIMRMQLAADIPERELKELGEELREEFAALPSVELVELHQPRRYELGIELSELSLQEYNLTLEQVAAAVRGYSLNFPGGKIRDPGGDIQVQTRAQADTVEDFASIPVIRKADGTVIYVGDVAHVIDGFEDIDVFSTYNGVNALELLVYEQGGGDLLKTTDIIKDYYQQRRKTLPDAVELDMWVDRSVNYRGRLDTLMNNGSSGLLLVFIVLVLFLRPVLAAWVCLGISVAFFGALWSLSLTPISLNVMSMFAFIMILGIVVDDAIIVGESIHSQQTILGKKRQGAIKGAQLVIKPVVFAVISTMVFFIPFFYLSDNPPTAHIATPVILALSFSLLESLLLLPSHLSAHRSLLFQKVLGVLQYITRPVQSALASIESKRSRIAEAMPHFAHNQYRNFLLITLSNKRLTLIVFGFFFAFAISSLYGGWLQMRFFPQVSGDLVSAEVTMPESAPYRQTKAVLQQLQYAAEQVKEELNEQYGYALIKGIRSTAYGNKARTQFRLDSSNERPLSSRVISVKFRDAIGEVQGATDLDVAFTINRIPRPLEFVLTGNSQQQLEGLSEDIQKIMQKNPAIFDVQSSLESFSNEITIKLNEQAATLSVSLRDVSQNIRRALYGEEVQRIPRQREDVKVLVRYPREDRSFDEALRDMYIASPGLQQEEAGSERIPLESLVDIEYDKAYKKIDRLDAKRVVKISSEVHEVYAVAEVLNGLLQEIKPLAETYYPDIDIQLDGEHQENVEFFQRVELFFILSMLTVFGLMAIMFHSYWQPVLVLTAVPFGFAGAIFGHLIVGSSLSMLSMLGGLACAGVVVNDNVVLIDRINRLRSEGYSPRCAVVSASIQRFRPIVLTSVTTFLGLTPILLETSVQSQFLKPMVISLSFGVLFATVVTLIFVPSLYLVGDNIMRRLGVRQVGRRTNTQTTEAGIA